MKKTLNQSNFFFVDESGDPTFYDRYGNLIIGQSGVSPLLILGFIKTLDPKPMRLGLIGLREQIANDMYTLLTQVCVLKAGTT